MRRVVLATLAVAGATAREWVNETTVPCERVWPRPWPLVLYFQGSDESSALAEALASRGVATARLRGVDSLDALRERGAFFSGFWASGCADGASVTYELGERAWLRGGSPRVDWTDAVSPVSALWHRRACSPSSFDLPDSGDSGCVEVSSDCGGGLACADCDDARHVNATADFIATHSRRRLGEYVFDPDLESELAEPYILFLLAGALALVFCVILYRVRQLTSVHHFPEDSTSPWHTDYVEALYREELERDARLEAEERRYRAEVEAEARRHRAAELEARRKKDRSV